MRPALLLLACLAAASAEERLEEWRLGAPVALLSTLPHVQGIDIEDGVLWVSSVDARAGKGYLARFELNTGKLLKQIEVQQGRRIHPGGITLDGDSIWVPVAEYNRRGPSSIERRNKTTLERISVFEVDDHIGSIAAGTSGLVGGNWDSVTLYRWTRDGRETGRTPNPRKIAYQDFKIVDGALVASGLLSKEEGAIDWLDPDTYALRRRVVAGKTSRGVPYTQEGMTFRGGALYLLPEDGPSRLFRFSGK